MRWRVASISWSLVMLAGPRTSPARTTRLVVASVSQATRAVGSAPRKISTTVSEIWSHTLSGWPSETDSLVKRKSPLLTVCTPEVGSRRIPLARDHIGFVPEPETAVFLQHFAGRIKIGIRIDYLRQPLILDLGHIDGGVPRREESRRADRLADLARQRVHRITEQRASIGIGVEIEIATGAAEFGLGGAQQLMAIGHERILARPDLLNDLKPRIVAVRVDADEAPARREAARQRRHDLGRLELDRRAGAIGLRGNDQIVIGAGRAAPRPHLVEEEFVILAVKHEHDRLFVDWISADLAHLGAPVLR